MCVRIALPLVARSTVLTSDEGASFTTVSQPQTRHVGVAEPTENASRLIARVQIGGGFPLMLGAMGLSKG